MTLITAPGDVTANSLVSLAEAEAYMAAIIPDYKADWVAADDPTKESVLIQASRLMGNLPWIGSRMSSAQILCWPRIAGVGMFGMSPSGIGWLYDHDGYPIPNLSIPWQVKNGTAEYAFRILSEDRTADAGGLVPTELKSGTTTITGLQRKPIPASVLDIVSSFLTCDPRSGGELVRS